MNAIPTIPHPEPAKVAIKPFAHGWLIQITQGERRGIECVFMRPEDEDRTIAAAWAAWALL